MPKLFLPITALAALAATAALCVAQQQAAPDYTPYQKFGQPKPLFTPVDQGVADRTQLSTSFRAPFKDLRLPTNFDREYRVDQSYRPHGLRSPTGFYARASAGIVAMYPQPLYKGVGRGVEQIAIPAGTVYLFADSAKLTGHRTSRYETQPQQPSLLQRLDAADPAKSQTAAMSALNEPLARQTNIVSRMTSQTSEARESHTVQRETRPIELPLDMQVDLGPSRSSTALDGSSIWTDETLRQSRVATLLSSALTNAPR